MIDNITLKNFKGMTDLKIEDLEKINVFVGRNETGKSTILEAVALTLSVQDDFKDIIKRNVLEDYFIYKYSSLLNLIKMGKNRSEITLNDSKFKIVMKYEENGITGNGHIDEVMMKKIDDIARDLALRNIMMNYRKNISKSENNINNEYIEEYKQDYIDKILNTETIILKSYIEDKLVNIKLVYGEPVRGTLRNQRTISDYIDKNETEFKAPWEIYSKKKVISPFIFYSSQRKIEFKELHDMAVTNKTIGDIIVKIKDDIRSFQDLRQSGEKFKILTKDANQAVPLEVRGDGFKSFIYMMFMENIMKKGVLILEEPENFLHPGLMGSWCKDVLSKSSSNQYFISTHNCEMIEYILEQPEIRKKVKFYKMFKEPFDYEAIDGDEAYERVVELKEDLRGI